MSIHAAVGDIVLYWAGKSPDTGEPAKPVPGIILSFNKESKCSVHLFEKNTVVND